MLHEVHEDESQRIGDVNIPIGLWDQQGGVPGSGDYPLYENTAYSIELNAASDIPAWKKSIRIMLEEDGYFDRNGFRYIGERQREIISIPRKVQHLSRGE